MVVTCDTPFCLRSPADNDVKCLPCQRGLRPLTNPKSPHAAGNSASVEDYVTEALKQELSKKVSAIIQQPKTDNNPPKNVNQGKTDDEIRILNKNAVEKIFNSYWYGWKDGCPPIFQDMFKKYGNFVPASIKPSTMVGTPATHRSSVNASGNQSFAIVKDVILPFEGKGAAMKAIGNSPALKDTLVGISADDAIAICDNNGIVYDFSKKGSGDVYTYDDNGVKRELPRWAIA